MLRRKERVVLFLLHMHCLLLPNIKSGRYCGAVCYLEPCTGTQPSELQQRLQQVQRRL